MCVSPQVSRRCPPPLPPARNYSPVWMESQSVGSDSSKHKHFPPPAQKPPPIPRYNGTNQSTQSSSSSSSCPYHRCNRKPNHEENASLLYKQPLQKWVIISKTYLLQLSFRKCSFTTNLSFSWVLQLLEKLRNFILPYILPCWKHKKSNFFG